MKLTPHLIVDGAARAIAWYQQVFDAREVVSYVDHKLDRVVHAKLAIGDDEITLSDENRPWKNDGPRALGGSPVVLTLQVDDADAVGARMVAAGATVIFPIADQFYGERQGRLADPFGHLWLITQRIREMSPEEIQRGVDSFPHA